MIWYVYYLASHFERKTLFCCQVKLSEGYPLDPSRRYITLKVALNRDVSSRACLMDFGYSITNPDYGPDHHVPYGETSMIQVGKPVYISVNVVNKIRESFVICFSSKLMELIFIESQINMFHQRSLRRTSQRV